MSYRLVEQAFKDLTHVTFMGLDAVNNEEHALNILERFGRFGDTDAHTAYAAHFVRADTSNEDGRLHFAWIRRELLDVCKEVNSVSSNAATLGHTRSQKIRNITTVVASHLLKMNGVLGRCLKDYDEWIGRVQANVPLRDDWKAILKQIHRMSQVNSSVGPGQNLTPRDIVMFCARFVISFALESLFRTAQIDIDSYQGLSHLPESFTITEMLCPTMLSLCKIKIPLDFSIQPGSTPLTIQFQLEDTHWLLSVFFDMCIGRDQVAPFFQLGQPAARHVQHVKMRYNDDFRAKVKRFTHAAFPDQAWPLVQAEIGHWQASFNHDPHSLALHHDAVTEVSSVGSILSLLFSPPLLSITGLFGVVMYDQS
ncbi:hypothetical protein OIO90_004576 [Microbotryomycetes sp. JL221]|nr:hypothetical protein OIO90_004576 [Microbotryomycetes sp. JL221]